MAANNQLAASAAWYAEPWLRRLCVKCPDPIGYVYFHDPFIAIGINGGSNTNRESKIAISPEGSIYFRFEQEPTDIKSGLAGGNWRVWPDKGDIRQLLMQVGLREHDECSGRLPDLKIEAMLDGATAFWQLAPSPTSSSAGRDCSVLDSARQPLPTIASLFNNPAVNQVPHSYSAEDVPSDLAEKLTIYPQIKQLRDLFAQSAKTIALASSAWHADPYVRRLCAKFKDPIASMEFNGNNLVVRLNCRRSQGEFASLAIGPQGMACSNIGNIHWLSDAAGGGDQMQQGMLSDTIDRNLNKLGVSERVD